MYSGEKYLCRAENGDEWFVVTTAYTCEDFSGKLKASHAESIALEWRSLDDLPDDIAGTQLEIVQDYLAMKKGIMI